MKIGVVLVTHYRLGEELLQALRLIVHDAPEFQAVSIEPSQGVDEMRADIQDALEKVDQGEGILVLTDMFGGTPSNLSYSFLEEGRVEVLSGVNLPIVIKALEAREKTELSALAIELEKLGKKSISLASGILKSQSLSPLMS